MEKIQLNHLFNFNQIYFRKGEVEVSSAIHSLTGKKYCIKKLFTPTIQEANEKYNEILMMSVLNHPNITRIRSCILNGSTNQIDSVLIIMDFYEEGDLESLIKFRIKSKSRWSEHELLRYSRELIEALTYMQGFNVCHRDLKPQNIFIKDSSLKIGDLGSSRSLSYKALRDDFSITGTPLYLSPALRLAYARSLNGGSSNVNHNPFKSDVFSLGLVLLYMASLEEVNSLAVVEGLQREINRRLEIIRENYPVVFELIRNMLVIEEDQRVDFLECFQILEKFFVFCEFCREKKVFNECLKKVDRFYCKECLQAVNLFEVDKLICKKNCGCRIDASLECECESNRCYICKLKRHQNSCLENLKVCALDKFVTAFQCNCERYISQNQGEGFYVCNQDNIKFCIVCLKVYHSQQNHERCNIWLELGYQI